MKSHCDVMQHMHDYVLNAMQNYVRDEVPSESNDHLSDDHSILRVSDEIDHFFSCAQQPGDIRGEVSG